MDELIETNPYEPQHDVVEETQRKPNRTLEHRVWFALVLGGLIAFAIGVIWLKLQRRAPTMVSPVFWTLAEIVAYGGMAIAIVGLVARLRVSVLGLTARFPDQPTTVFGWNCLPAGVSILAAVGWFSLGCLGLYSLFVELANWNFRSGLPILELILQALLYGSGLLASASLVIAGRQWMHNNHARALTLSAIGLFGPIAAAVVLFKGCENLVRFLV